MNKLMFRILGAIASSLIIISVFVPFSTVTNQALWDIYETTNALYLPIMIIAFGAIGVLFFSLNVKTEFTYMSTGAIIFFVVTQLVSAMNQSSLDKLSMGFYFLCIGAVITGLMAFICNLKPKRMKTIEENVNNTNREPMIKEIDRLYSREPIAPMENIVTPTITPITPVISEPANNLNSIDQMTPIPELSQPQSMTTQNVNNNLAQPVQNVPLNNVNNNIQASNPVVDQFNNNMQTPNPVVGQFNNNIQASNPVVGQFNNNMQTPNPVVGQFNNNMQTPNPVVDQFNNSVQTPNPVVDQFNNNVQTPNPVVTQFETIKDQGFGLTPEPPKEILNNQNDNSNSSGLGIFGQ